MTLLELGGNIEYERTRKKLKDTQYELSSTRTALEQKIITLEQGARESEIIKKKLMARVDSLESDRRFLYEQEKSTSKKYQALEESSAEFKVKPNMPDTWSSLLPTIVVIVVGFVDLIQSPSPFSDSFNRQHPMKSSGTFVKR
jgi:uncharacterized protein YhaN